MWGPFFWEKTVPAATYPQVRGFQKYGGQFYEKNSLEQRTHNLGASKSVLPKMSARSGLVGKTSWPHLGPFGVNFSLGRKNAKHTVCLLGAMAAIQLVWANRLLFSWLGCCCCYWQAVPGCCHGGRGSCALAWCCLMFVS